jgi:1-acyl-sn-glycerol-3-phosphate acyltransferase
MRLMTLQDLARANPIANRRWLRGVERATSLWLRVPGSIEIAIEGPMPTGERPMIYACNHTHSLDFLPIRYAMYRRGQELCTWIKPRAYLSRMQSKLLENTGNIPIVSRGYLIAADFQQLIGRRPTEDEYSALRDHVDHGTKLGSSKVFEELRNTDRDMLGRSFESSRESYSYAIHQLFAQMMATTLDIAKRAAEAGRHMQIYPQGTVSPRLTAARTGIVQAAAALNLPVVPVGISGVPQALAGGLRRTGGRIVIRFGSPIRVRAPEGFQAFHHDHERRAEHFLAARAADITEALDRLLDPPHQMNRDQRAPRATLARFL